MRFVKPIWPNSISFKVFVAYILGVILSIIFVSLVIFWIMIVQSQSFASRDVADLTEEMAKHFQFDANGKPVGLNNEGDDDDGDGNDNDFAWLFEGLKQEIAYRVLDESGHIVLESVAGEEFWPSDNSAQELKPKQFQFKLNGTVILGATAPVVHEGKTWYFQLAVSQRFHYLLHQRVALPLMGLSIALFSLVLLVVFSVCACITLGYTLKPLREVSESAAAISPRSLGARLSVKRIPSEIAPLVNSFNHALDRLEKGYRTQQEFLATAAHELKTPLALIRAQIEVKEKSEYRKALLNDVAHMSRQVQQLLMLAEVSEVQNYKLNSVDVVSAVREVVAYLEPMTKAADVHVTIAHGTEISWQADKGALFTLLKNLLENAIQHAPQGSEVRIEIDAMVLTVRDWGSGIPQEQLSKIFTRFWRGAHRRDLGAGLGLAICQEIALAHGWTLSAHSAEPGLYLRLSRPAPETLI